MSSASSSVRLVHATTTASVVLLAVIAAIISYRHMHTLALRHGEGPFAAALVPLSVDGMIVAASMSLLQDSRRGRRGGVLPWALLIAGSAASLAANVAVAEPTFAGRVIAAWPPFALIGAYELLMRQIRNAAAAQEPEAEAAMAIAGAAHDAIPESGVEEEAVPEETESEPIAAATLPAPPRLQRDGNGNRRVEAARRQHEAWQWALANRLPDGKLPSGTAIAQRFGKSDRWGRLVAQAGKAGRLSSLLVPRYKPRSPSLVDLWSDLDDGGGDRLMSRRHAAHLPMRHMSP